MTFKHKLSKRLAISWVALVLGCAMGDRTVGPGQPEFSLATSRPATVADLRVTARTDTSLSLAFTAVDDGTGLPASYDVRVAAAPISWGGASSVARGSCTTPVSGAAIDSTVRCTVLGLRPATAYEAQLVPFRGTLNLNAVFGELSSIARASTDTRIPGTITDLVASGATDTTMTLTFTEASDGFGAPASYDVRFAVAPISWGSATVVSRGTCKSPM